MTPAICNSLLVRRQLKAGRGCAKLVGIVLTLTRSALASPDVPTKRFQPSGSFLLSDLSLNRAWLFGGRAGDKHAGRDDERPGGLTMPRQIAFLKGRQLMNVPEQGCRLQTRVEVCRSVMQNCDLRVRINIDSAVRILERVLSAPTRNRSIFDSGSKQ